MNGAGPSDWTARRRAIAWVNIVLQAAIVLSLLVVVNLIARRSPRRYDMTSRQ